MAFTEINFMDALRTFLVQYPTLQPGERLEIDYLAVDPRNPNRPQGEALAVAGSNIVRERSNVIGERTHDEQTNFILILRRYTNDNEFRLDVGNFLINYIRWINYEQSLRGTRDEHPDLPYFGDTGEGERIRASGGMQTAVELESGVDEFQIQIQVQYQTMYQ